MAIEQGNPDRLLAHTIRRQLKTDAATSELSVHVSVHHGVVHLHASVDNLMDPDSIESVMWRIPGVRGVIEDLDLS